MLTFVLVHGGWHDGSCWDEVAAGLRNAGHTVYAPTIAGNGKSANRKVNHANCTASIVDYILANNIQNLVLVGHSYGGTIIAKVAEAVAERLRRIVFFNAFVLNDGSRSWTKRRKISRLSKRVLPRAVTTLICRPLKKCATASSIR